VCERCDPVEPVCGELQPSTSGAKGSRRSTRRGRHHRVPGPSRLPVLVCQRSLIVSDTRDVEKRWRDPEALRQAIRYGAAVIVVAGVAFAVFAVVDKGSVVLASTVPAILFLGGVGALVRAYRVWRAGGTWVIWQGAGWFLLTLMLVCLSIPWSAAMFTSGVR
jgi:hypothetical protein